MCQSVLKDVTKTIGTGGLSLAADAVSKKKGKDANATAIAARSSAAKNRAAGVKQEQTRAKQIGKFRANVASGGAKRAANV